MPRAITLIFLVAVARCPGCTTWERLPVKLFNDAVVGSNALELAKEETAWLLKSVCVVVNWILCPVATSADFITCSAPAHAAELHILASPLTDNHENVMGTAILMDGSAGRAGVFLSRVQEMVDSEPGIISVPLLLGHVMAHEIGHLLLRSTAHSIEGVMRAGFRRLELKKASQRRLTFTRQQNSAIKQRVVSSSTVKQGTVR